MSIKNSSEHYGWLSIALHWLMAIGLIGLYFLGIYMVGLGYYDPGYNTAPALHKSIGIVLTALLFIRLAWIYSHSKPEPIETKQILRLLAILAHLSLYFITLLLIISGYLISTAKGQGIDIFSIFQMPVLYTVTIEQSEFLGKAHDVLATVFIIMVALHTSAALAHHFYFKDNTLKRILWAKTTTTYRKNS